MIFAFCIDLAKVKGCFRSLTKSYSILVFLIMLCASSLVDKV
jgi:hypothetical protein